MDKISLRLLLITFTLIALSLLLLAFNAIPENKFKMGVSATKIILENLPEIRIGPKKLNTH